MTEPRFRDLLRDPVLCLAFGFGSGLAPRAPGTFGTAVAIPLFLLLYGLGVVIYAQALALALVGGVAICGHASRKLGVHDHGGIVWDEIAGYLIAAWPLQLIAHDWPLWAGILAAFALFRIFDILKPWPIGWLDRRLGGGLGIMVDDVVAGVVAAALLMPALVLISIAQ